MKHISFAIVGIAFAALLVHPVHAEGILQSQVTPVVALDDSVSIPMPSITMPLLTVPDSLNNSSADTGNSGSPDVITETPTHLIDGNGNLLELPNSISDTIPLLSVPSSTDSDSTSTVASSTTAPTTSDSAVSADSAKTTTAPVAKKSAVSTSATTENLAFNFTSFQKQTTSAITQGIQTVNTAITSTVQNTFPHDSGASYVYPVGTFSPETTKRLDAAAAASALLGIGLMLLSILSSLKNQKTFVTVKTRSN